MKFKEEVLTFKEFYIKYGYIGEYCLVNNVQETKVLNFALWIIDDFASKKYHIIETTIGRWSLMSNVKPLFI